VERSIKLTIDHRCPQCGAPISLEETDRLITCGFCRVRSYLIDPDYFCYTLPHAAIGSQSLVYFPYWRFKGMLFSFSPAGIGHRFVDVSQQAIGSMHFPLSLGLRSQALRLKFVTPEIAGLFLKPKFSVKSFFKLIDERFNSECPKPILHQAHVGENLSLIYAPFYVKDRVYDAVLNQPLTAQRLPENFRVENFDTDTPAKHLRFLATLCPQCGWDLQGERDSVVLHCPNCASGWRPLQNQLARLDVAHLPAAAGKTRFMPFWRIKATVSGLNLATYADLVRIANLPKVILDKWQSTEFRFWGPAFKVRPQNYLQVATSLTVAQPMIELEPRMPEGRMHPVNLPLQEALETLKLNLANFMRPRQAVVDRIQEIQITPTSYLLVYLPFEERQHEWVLPSINLAINKNQLALASNL
jgi:hypothetical protein